MENINSSTNSKLKSFLGIPLITRLIGEYFKEEMEDESLINQDSPDILLNVNYSALDLIRKSVEKSFEIYCTKQIGMDRNNPNFKIKIKELEDLHIKLAFKVLLPKIFYKVFPYFFGFNDNITKFIKSGLVVYENGQFKFCHLTTAEYLVVKYIKDNFRERHVFKFICKTVLINANCFLIRSFLNEFFSEIVNDENKKFLKDFICKNYEILNVAAKEANYETFKVLFNVLIEDEQHHFKNWNHQRKIRKLFTAKDKSGFTLFYNLLYFCENPIEIMEKLKNKIGIKFIKEIFQIRNGKSKLTLIAAASHHGNNYVHLSKWIEKNFSKEPEFIKAISLTKDQLKYNFLHTVIKNYEKNLYLAMLLELKGLRNNSQNDILKEVILYRNHKNETFLHKLVQKYTETTYITEYKIAECFEIVMKSLIWIGQTSDCLGEFLFYKREPMEFSLFSFLTTTFRKNPTEILNPLHKKLNSMDFFLYKNEVGNSFLTEICYYTESETVEILALLENINLFLFESIVFNKNKQEQNFVHIFCDYSKEFIGLIKKILEWLEFNIADFSKAEFLRLEDCNGRKSMELIIDTSLQEEDLQNQFEILEWVQDIVFKWNVKNHPNDVKDLANISLDPLHFNIDAFSQFMIHKFNAKILLNFLYEQKCLKNYFEDDFLDKKFSNIKTVTGQTFLQLFFVHSGSDKFESTTTKIMSFLKSSNSTHVIFDKNKEGNSFFPYLICGASKESEKSLINALTMMNEFDSELLLNLIDNKNDHEEPLIHQVLHLSDTNNLFLDFLRYFFDWIKLNLPKFNFTEFLLQVDSKGNTFLPYVISKNAFIIYNLKSQFFNILDWMITKDENILFELVQLENKNKENLIHQLCKILESDDDYFDFFKIFVYWFGLNILRLDNANESIRTTVCYLNFIDNSIINTKQPKFTNSLFNWFGILKAHIMSKDNKLRRSFKTKENFHGQVGVHGKIH